MKKKIIFVTKALWIGGIETALVNLLNHFNYEKYDVTLLVLHAELDMMEQIHPRCRVIIADREKVYSFEKEYKYKKLYHLTENTENPSNLHRIMMWSVPLIKWIENRLYIRYIRKMMKQEYFDTAVIYSDVVAETAIRAIKADKYLMYYHHGAMRHVYHDKIGYKKCEKIIAVSSNQAEELKRFIPQAKDKIITMHNLTDVDGIRKKAEEPIEELFDNDKFNIVSVGRVSYEKGMDLAVKACAKLVKDGYENIRWWIVGDGPAMDEVKSVIKECEMQRYVNLVGMKDNPYPYIKKADVYVQPSRCESFGLTISEALILGKNIISTDTMGARELLTEKSLGRICKMKSADIAYAIENEINDEKRFEVPYNSWDRFNKKNQEILQQLDWVL
ncbi:MAG: glycosyltransferase [Eubacterium sp.]|nr:glycosyltransferase [Eubacterium sp.]